MPAPVLPAHVATGELITSAWGNGVVDSLAFAPVNSGGNALGSTAMVSGSTILVTSPPPVTYPTIMYVVANVWGGADGGNMDGLVLSVVTVAAGSYNTPQLTTSVGNRFGHQTAGVQYFVGANASAQFSLRPTWTSAAGTTFVAADVLWWQYRQPLGV